MVRDKPPAEVVLPQFKSFVGNSVLVAYNAAFDMKFLEQKAKQASSSTIRCSMLCSSPCTCSRT